MRLNKFISNSGYSSRRKADEIIKSGLVTVNGEIIKNIGHDVSENDYVKVDGKTIQLSKGNVYFALYKPRGYLSSNSDIHHDKLAVDLINYNKKLQYVGRLDLDSEGLIILTDDGEFTNIMTHPSFQIKKTYLVYINDYVPDRIIKEIENGVKLEDGLTQKCLINVKNRNKYQTKLEIQIYEGRNRQIRRMFEKFNFTVNRLIRTKHGEISLNGLIEGKYRQFDKNELKYVKELLKIHGSKWKKVKKLNLWEIWKS